MDITWITEDNPSGKIWKLYEGSQPVGIIFKSWQGYVVNADEYPTFQDIDKAKEEAVKIFLSDASYNKIDK